MARRPTPGVTHGRPAFPAPSSTPATPRPTPAIIKPAVPAQPGDDGNQAQAGQFGPRSPGALPDQPPGSKSPRPLQYKGKPSGGF
jgi:hypothetical protein